MSRLLWIGGWVTVGLWSLFAFAAYGVLDLATGTAMRNADWFSTDPETVEWLFRVFGFVRGASNSVVLVVWGFVSLGILSVPWLFDRLVGRPGQAPVRRATAGARPGVIDLDPADYAVVREPPGAGPARNGPAPRIGRGPGG